MSKRICHITEGLVVNITMESDDFQPDNITTVEDTQCQFGIRAFYDAETGKFSFPPLVITNYDFKAYRDLKIAVEIDIELQDSSNENFTVTLFNDDKTKAALGDKLGTLNSYPEISTLAFWAKNGWFDLNSEQYRLLKLNLDLHTQKCFDAQREIEQNHSVKPYVDETWQSDFDTLLQGKA